MARLISYILSMVFLVTLSTADVFAAECTRAPTADELASRLKKSERSIYMVKYDDSLLTLDELESDLPCAEFTVDKESLTKLFLLRGVASFNSGNERGALADFRRALAIDLSMRWNERFGQKPRELFLEAKSGLIVEDKGEVRLPVPADGMTFYLDGMPAPPTGGLEVVPGRHLLQVFKSDGLLVGVWLDVPSGGTVLPPLPREAGRPVAAVAPTPVTQPREPSDGSWKRPTSLALMGVGAASAIAGGVSSGLYWQSRLALQNGDYYSNRPDDEKDKLLARQNKAALVANITLPTAAAFLGAGAALYWMDSRSEGSAYIFTPWADRESAGLALSGRF